MFSRRRYSAAHKSVYGNTPSKMPGWFATPATALASLALTTTCAGREAFADEAPAQFREERSQSNEACMSSRAMRNRNPGNVERRRDDWIGAVDPVHARDPRFIEFVDYAFGIRAMAIVIENYALLYSISTIEELIERYAPPGDNVTEAYIEMVSDVTGYARSQPIDFTDSEVLRRIVSAMIRMEAGCLPFTDEYIKYVIEKRHEPEAL